MKFQLCFMFFALMDVFWSLRVAQSLCQFLITFGWMFFARPCVSYVTFQSLYGVFLYICSILIKFQLFSLYLFLLSDLFLWDLCYDIHVLLLQHFSLSPSGLIFPTATWSPPSLFGSLLLGLFNRAFSLSCSLIFNSSLFRSFQVLFSPAGLRCSFGHL